MIITTRSKFLMFLFGWGQFPSYVTADTKLWRKWLFKNRHGETK